MTIPLWLKSKWVIAGAIVLVIGVYLGVRSSNAPDVYYDTVKVEQGTLQQTVEATGALKPQDRIDLSFKTSGKLESLKVAVGDQIAPDQELASLEAKDLSFSVSRARAVLASAQANLSARLAGETSQSIEISQAAVDQARATYEKAKTDLEATKRSVVDEVAVAQIALDTAQKNLDNGKQTQNQTVEDSYESLKSKTRAAQGDLQTALADGDAIIGVDNTAANDGYEPLLGVNDRIAVDRAKTLYISAKSSSQFAFSLGSVLNANSTNEDVKRASEATRTALRDVQSYLDQVQRALTGTIPGLSLSESSLASKKATIDGDRTAISTQLTTMTAAIQSTLSAELAARTTISQLENALATAQTNLRTAETNRTNKVATAESNVTVQLAALKSAEASLALKKAPPRSVDVAGLRAQVLDAQVAYNQAADRLKDALILSPVSGTVAEIVPSLGEQVTAGAAVIRVVAENAFQVEALVPETDIAKVEVGQKATITLDAYGDEVPFEATVVSEDPDQTKVQDAVYYKVFFVLETAGRDVKPGMTANVTILTAEVPDALMIPIRSVREENGKRFVRVLVNGAPEDREVRLGTRGDEGRVQVMSGLEVGEEVVIGELTPAEYKQQQAQQ